MKRFAQFSLDTRNECLWREDTQIALSPKLFAVLRYLVENPGRLIPHDELLDALWPETYVQPQVLRTYVLELRKILGDDPGRPDFIQTLPKRGYCFVAQVTEWSEPDRSLERSAKSTPPPLPQVAPVNVGQNTMVAEVSTRGQNDQKQGGLIARIVGRNEELTQLKSSFGMAAAGQRQVVFVNGEVGIGKTALVDAFSQWAVDSSAAIVTRSQCVEGFGAKEEYYPVMEILSQLCTSADAELACRTLAAIAPAWLSNHGIAPAGRYGVVPTTDNLMAPLETKARVQERMPGDICSAFEEMSAERPIVMVFEDLHWADSATVHLISALARRRSAARLMIVVTVRPQNVVMEHPLKGVNQDLRMKRLCAEIDMPPMPRSAVRELIARELQQSELPSGLTDFVCRHSEGNPLFAIAILEHLIAQGYLLREGNCLWTQHAPFTEMEAGVPDGLARMIELEMERLTQQEQCILEAGSLMTVAFPAWSVAAALKMDLAEIEETCDALARKLYFMERVGQDELPNGMRSTFYVFSHGLYREVLYWRQSAHRRSQRHVRIAEELSELFQGREASVARDIAMHYEAAGDWQRAVNALRDASRSAQRRQALAEAIELLERALRIAESLSNGQDHVDIQEIQRELTGLYQSPVVFEARLQTMPSTVVSEPLKV